jgi:transcriptional regulator with XRE-family HTH domain
MDAALAIRTAREHAGLSKRELARRAATSPAAIVHYEAGTRDPTVGTLVRIIEATGVVGVIDLAAGPPRPTPVVNARRLAAVLDLAERLPRRAAARDLEYPPLPGRR